MLDTLRAVLDPPRYHGHGRRPPFFEGWYFKLVDASGARRYAVIPGIFLAHEVAASHAFVQVLDGRTGHATYHSYPLHSFWAARDRFAIRVGPNAFSAGSLSLDIDSPDRAVRGAVRLQGTHAWPVRLWSPGAMGWYAWVPSMETYHGVVSMDHRLEGVLEVDEMPVVFDGGRGYVEKDWGRRLPEAWIWFQSNHFPEPGISLTASLAIVPWRGRPFAGFVTGLLHNGRLYRLATYTGARIAALQVDDRQIHWQVADGRCRLEMTADRAEGGVLRAPQVVDMDRRVPETLNATVSVRLQDRQGVVYEGTGRYAGLEAVGDLARLVAMAT
mgnify:CR=1 FL=1